MHTRSFTFVWLAAGLAAVLLGTPVAAARAVPNQGNPEHILTVDDPSIECDAVPGAKTPGGRSGRVVHVRSAAPIDRVTLKAGNKASVVRTVSGRDDDGMYWMTIELSKHVGTYVVWTCPDDPAGPTSPHDGSEGTGVLDRSAFGSPITFEAAWDCIDPRPEGLIAEPGLGASVEIESVDPIDRVTVIAGAGADVLGTDARYADGQYRVGLELTDDILVYQVWSCPDADGSDGRPADPVIGPLATAIASGQSAEEAILARFPTSIGDLPVQISSYDAQEWLATGGILRPVDASAAEETLRSLVQSAGLAVDDVTIVSGLIEPSPGNHAVLAAIGLPGADGENLLEDVISLMLGDVVEARMAPESLGGKVVVRVSDASNPGAYPRNLYVDGDIIWLIEAGEPLREEIAAALG